MTSVVDIDDLLAAAKALAGKLEWREEGNTARLAAPVMVDGSIRGGLIVHTLHAQGIGPAEIARQLGIGRASVYRHLKAAA